jgi:hypothetical protein
MMHLRKYTRPLHNSTQSGRKRFESRTAQDVRGVTAHSAAPHLGKVSSGPRCIPRPGLSALGPDRARFAPLTPDGGDFISPAPLDHGEIALSPGPHRLGRSAPIP